MSVLDSFIGQRRQTRQDANQTAWQRYKGLLEQFASGQEVDSTEADEILQAVGRSESDLQRDVSIFEKRVASFEQLRVGGNATEEMRLAEQDIYRMQNELVRIQQDYKSRLDAARMSMATCESRMYQSKYAEDSLRANLLDPSLQPRELELNNERRSLAPRRQELLERIRGCRVDYHEQRLRQLEHKRSFISYVSGSDDDLRKCRVALDIARRDALPWVEQLADIDARLSAIDSELSAIDVEKLKP